GTGSVKLLLVGRLIRRERSAARATMKTTSSEKRAKRETTAVFFTSEGLGRVLPSRACGGQIQAPTSSPPDALRKPAARFAISSPRSAPPLWLRCARRKPQIP